MDDDDGEAELALEGAEESEEGADVASRVFVGVVKLDKGVEDEESGSNGVKGVEEPLLVLVVVEVELSSWRRPIARCSMEGSPRTWAMEETRYRMESGESSAA